MRKVIALVIVVAAWAVLSLGAVAPGAGPSLRPRGGTGPSGPVGPLTISVSEGVVGTSVTITGGDCGTRIPLASDYIVNTGWLIVQVPGWPEPFPSGFEGGNNNTVGVATATFVVPDVTPGVYAMNAVCQDISNLRAGLADVGTPSAAPYATGPYAAPVSFTVLAPAAPVTAVAAPASTVG